MTTTYPGGIYNHLSITCRRGRVLSVRKRSKPEVAIDPPAIHEGACDASGAVPTDPSGEFFLVADDEEQECVLRLYKTRQSGPPVEHIHLRHDRLAPAGEELDLEAAAWLGPRIYWIGSHSRDKKGKKQTARQRLFATRLNQSNSTEVALDGEPYPNLIPSVKEHLKGLGKKWAGWKLDPKIPPKEGGLSIEGIAGSPDGELLIGLRSPLLGEGSVVLRMRNPDEVIAGKDARFGKPAVLNLGGLGIRSLEYCGLWREFLVLAGSRGPKAQFVLHRWDGKSENVKPVIDFAGMDLPDGVAPEGMFFCDEDRQLQFLFDEGKRMDGKVECKKGKQKSFRSICVRGLVR